MKKILLLLSFMVICQWASAIELTFWLGNRKITPGETVKFTDIDVTKYEEDGYKEVTMKPELYISSNIFSTDIKLTVTCTSGQSIQVCAGGVCKGGETVVKEGITLRASQKLELGFDYVNYDLDLDEAIPTVITRIEAEDVTEPASKVEFVIEMSEHDASVGVIETSGSLKPVNGGIAYSTDGVTPLCVAGILGEIRFNGNISGKGVINLPKGLYVYKLGDKAGKMYVK